MTAIPPDMRPLFSAECEDYLALLTEGFLALEVNPGQAEWVDRMFRAAHSLKGTARVMGCMDLAQAAHALEDVLSRLREGRIALGLTHFDHLSRAMDGFGQLLHATLEEQETAPLAAELESWVRGCLEAVPEPPEAADLPETRPAAPLLGTSPVGIPAESSHAPLEVLRVPVPKLDALLNQVGELLVARQRQTIHAEEAAELRDFLEETLRRISQDKEEAGRIVQRANRLAQALAEEAALSERSFEALEAAVLRTRMVPLSTLFEPAAKWVRDMASAMGKQARLETAGGEIELDKRLAEGLRDPLLHLIRNALDHGIELPDARRLGGKPEQGLLRLSASQERNGILLRVEDDGRGVDLAMIREVGEQQGLLDGTFDGQEDLLRLLFRPGFSTRKEASEFSGRGVGLDVVATEVADLKGDLQLFSKPGLGTQIHLWLPQSLASTRVLQVSASGVTLGLPSVSVRACLKVSPGERQLLEGRPALLFEGKPILMVSAGGILGRPARTQELSYVVVLEAAGDQVALGVDELVGEFEVLEKPLPMRLKGLKSFHGASLMGDGRILLLADPIHLVRLARSSWLGKAATLEDPSEIQRPRTILLADDSLTTRVQLRRILEAAGYKVQPAVDGLDAWGRLGTQAFDAVVSDVQMPGLDGYQLTERIRSSPTLARLPVVLVTTLASEEDRRRGLDAGANAYLSKGSFDQEQLLESLRNLI